MGNNAQCVFCLPKDSKKHAYSSHNAIPCYVDGRLYPSLNSMAVDMELDFSWLYLKLKKNDFAPITISNHLIIIKSWLDSHPEYNMTGGKK